MKHLKKVFALMAALVMAVALAVPAMAVNITSVDADHTYQVYQIFTGDYDAVEGNLSNMKWGANAAAAYTQGDLVAKAVIDAIMATASQSDAQKLAVIEPYANLEGTPFKTITGAASVDVPAGYYLIRDVAGSLAGTTEAYTLHLVKVLGTDLTITPKTGAPTVEKKIKETNDTTGVVSGWQDGADYDIDDVIPFQLTATLPANYDKFAHYYISFNDTMSKGLTFGSITSIKINGTGDDIKASFTIPVVTAGTTDATGADGAQVWSIKNIADLKTAYPTLVSGDKIVVEYTATLNENAVIGQPGNPNTVNLTFTQNPNWDGNGEEEKTPGKTPDDTVIAFTYTIEANKLEGDTTTALKGAGFTLYKKVGSDWVAQGAEIKGADVTTFTFKGQDAGEYKLVETTVPAGYNKAEDLEFTVTATYDEAVTGSAVPALKTLTVTPSDKLTADLGAGKVSTDIRNYKGTVLPGTGGVGTTVFYVIGGLLMVGAAVLLVAKKRMSNVNK